MRNQLDPFARKNRPGYKPLFTSRTLTSVLALGTALAAPVTNAISGNFATANGLVGTYNNTGGSFDNTPYNGSAFAGQMTSGGNGSTAAGRFIDANTDRIYVATASNGQNTAILNWTPFDTTSSTDAIAFLPAGKTVEFVNDTSNAGAFTVINRIIPDGAAVNRRILIDGAIKTLDFSLNPTSQGSVWLYSPGGLLIGANANIDVGGLLLSSLDPTSLNNGGANGATFTNTSGLNSRVEVMSGAQIAVDNYIGIVAPNVVQNGTVTVGNAGGTTNVSAAYVAAEEATLTLNQGLFDISVAVGTDGEGAQLPDGSRVALTHGGTTTGPANDFEQNVSQQIKLVAVPKNSAITMLIEGTGKLGFEIANSVQQNRNSIVLLGGYNVTPEFNPSDPSATRESLIFARAQTIGDPNTTFANISITGSTASAPGDPKFLSDVVGFATGDATINANTGTSLDFARNLTVNTSHLGLGEGVSATGGTLKLQSSGGAINVAGFTSLISNGYGSATSSMAAGGIGIGGLVSAVANGGSVTLAGVELYSDGFGGDGLSNGATGGAGYGGGLPFPSDPIPNPIPTGALLNANGTGTLTISGPTMISAGGYGGQSENDAGTGYGGRAVIFNASTQQLTLNGLVTIYADGVGGTGYNGGAAAGGFAQIGAANASVVTNSSALLYARAIAGQADHSNGGLVVPLPGETTLSLRGGTALLSRDGAGGTIIGGSLTLNATAYGLDPDAGSAFAFSGDFAVGGAATAQGGQATVFATNGGSGGGITINGGLYAYAEGYGGDSDFGTGATGTGGSAQINARSGANISIFGDALLFGGGYGGAGNSGGDGFGGRATVTADGGGTIAVMDNGMSQGLQAIADGRGGSAYSEGDGGNGGRGVGGFASVQAFASTGAPTTITLGNAYASAAGYGGDGGSGFNDGVAADGGTGGIGVGGYFFDNNGNQTGGVVFGGTAGGGVLTINGTASANVEGVGGRGGNGIEDIENGGGSAGGAGGIGSGGLAQAGVLPGPATATTNGSLNFNGSYVANVKGTGGDGGDGATDGDGAAIAAGGTGGLGSGGSAKMLEEGAFAFASSVAFDATGNGGDGGSGTVQGMLGRGSGGDVAVIASPRFGTSDVSTLQINAGGINANVGGYAGGGSPLGTTDPVAISGEFQIAALDGGTINSGSITVLNNGVVAQRLVIDETDLQLTTLAPRTSEITAIGGGTITLGSNATLTLQSPGDIGVNVDALSSISVPGAVAIGGTATSRIVQSYTPNGSNTPITAFNGSGVFSAASFNIFANSIDTSAILNKTTGSFTLTVPGAIKVGGLRAINGNVTVVSQQGFGLNLGTIIAGGAVLLNVQPAAPTTPLSPNSTILTGDITAGASVIAAGMTIATGNVISGDTIGLTSTVGGVTYGSLSAGIVNPVSQSQQGYGIGIRSAGAVSGGAIAARGNVGIVGQAGTITVGDIASQQQSIVLLGKGAVATGSLSAGSTTQGIYVADAAMFGANNQSLDPTVYFGQAPTPIAAFGQLPGSLSVNGSVTGRSFIAATSASTQTGAITATGPVAITAGGAVSVGGVSGATTLNLVSTAANVQSSGALSASGNITLTGATGVDVGSIIPATGVFQGAAINSGGQVSINSSGGGARVGNVTGGLVLATTAGALNAGTVTSVTNASLQASEIAVGSVIARDSIGLTATTGGVSFVNLNAGISNPVTQSQQGWVIGINSNGAVSGGTVLARGNVGIVARNGTITTGAISSQQQSVVLLGKGTLTTGSISAGSATQGVYVADASMFAANNGSLDPTVYFAQAPTSIGSIQSPSGTLAGALLVNGDVTGARFLAAANGLIRTTGNVTLTGALNLRGGGINLGNVNASVVSLNGIGSINTLAITSPGLVSLTSGVFTTTGAVSGSIIASQSGGNIVMGNLTAPGGVFIASLQPTIQVAQPPAGTVTLGNITASAGGVDVYSQRGNVTTGNVTAADFLSLRSDSGGVTAGNLQGSDVNVFALGAITTGSVTATVGEIDIEAGPDTDNDDLVATPGADVTTGALVAVNAISVSGGGNIRVGSATIATPTNRDPNEFYEVKIGAGGNLTVGAISAPGTVGLASLTGTIAAGNITTQDSVAALASGNASFGSVMTGNGGTVYVGNASQLSLVDTDDGIDTSLLFATAPARAGGTVSFAGPVSTGRFDVASTSGFTAGNVTASSVRVNTGGGATFGNVVDSGAFTVTSNGISTGTLQAASVSATAGTGAASFGTVTTPGAFTVGSGAFTASGINAASVQITANGAATFNGAVAAPTINVASTDIAIGANGSLGNASTTALTLTNSGTGPSTLGGTAQATGYTLDASEIGRLRATQIAFNSAGNVTFQTATINAATALNTATGGFRVQTPGSIRIAGNVDFTNMAATNTATFVAGQRFEIVTPTGQLRLLGAGNTVNGVANITAANVAVGNATLLDQLAVNPRFVGRDTALGVGNTGDAVNSAGYIQGGRLAFTVGNTLLIANSGTATAPAGFTAGTGGVTVAAGQGQGSVDVVIYGRSLDATGTPTSSSGTVSTVVISPDSAGRISTLSSVNGCGFGTTTCGTAAAVTNTVQNQLTQIAATLQSAVTGIGGNATNGPAGGSADNGGTVNDNAATDEGSDGEDDAGTTAAAASATRVNVLIDTSSIGGGGPMIDTPVTSSGNSSLWGGDAGSDVGSTGAGGLGDTSGPLGDFGGGSTGGLGGAVGGASFGGTTPGGATGGAGLSGAAGSSSTAGATPTGGAGSAGGAASAGGTTGGAASGNTGSTGGAAGSAAPAGGGEGGTSASGGGSSGGAAAGGTTEGGAGGGTAATPSGEAGAGAGAATAATEGASNSGGGGGGEAGSSSEGGATPGGAAGGASGGAGGSGNSSGNNKDEKTDKPQGGTTGGIN